jgi:hypothetical protein
MCGDALQFIDSAQSSALSRSIELGHKISGGSAILKVAQLRKSSFVRPIYGFSRNIGALSSSNDVLDG